jgi:dihydrofolate reductase
MCNHQLRMAGRLPRNHAPRHARAPPDGDRATHIEGDTDMSTTTASRSFIAAMQMTLDGYSLGPDGEADWVDSWADGLGLLPEVDAFILGGGMFPQYEQFWKTLLDDPAAVAEWIGRDPYPREVEYARVAAETPHLVLSTTLDQVSWPNARIVRDMDAIRAFKAQPGGSVYVVGGPGLLRSFIDGDLLDELRLIVHPVVVGAGTALFDGIGYRQALDLVATEPTTSGQVHLTYRAKALATAAAA